MLENEKDHDNTIDSIYSLSPDHIVNFIPLWAWFLRKEKMGLFLSRTIFSVFKKRGISDILCHFVYIKFTYKFNPKCTICENEAFGDCYIELKKIIYIHIHY